MRYRLNVKYILRIPTLVSFGPLGDYPLDRYVCSIEGLCQCL